MSIPVAHNDNLICIMETKDTITRKIGTFEYEEKTIPIYKVVSVGKKVNNFKEGDLIICNSNGGKFVMSDKSEFYLFKEENVMSVIID